MPKEVNQKPSHRLAKLTAPKVSGAIMRERLFRKVDQARTHPIVWISGPGGAGKTTLLTSYLKARKIQPLWYQLDEGDADAAAFFYYLGLAVKYLKPRQKVLPLLTPEHLAGLSAFTRFFFRQFFERLPNPGLVVMDNFQTVPENSPFHQVLPVALEEIPTGSNVIILSRHQPPAALSRLQANDQLTAIDAQALCLDGAETEALVQDRHKSPVPEAIKQQWRVSCAGWVAGLILLMERYQYGTNTVEMETYSSPENLFDYFASEVFNHTENKVQDFLLKSALLPTMSIANASALTQQRQAGKFLAELVRKHYFTTRHRGRAAVYQYHPLFRAFLLARGRERLNVKLQRQLKQQAARILVEDNPEQSIVYWLELADWEAFAQTLERCAPVFLHQGRNQTVLNWLKDIPDAMFERIPDLFYWRGTSLQLIDSYAVREALTKAYHAFKSAGNVTGMHRAWFNIIIGFWYDRADHKLLDLWLEELNYLHQHYPRIDCPILRAQFATAAHMALGLRGKDYDELLSWEKQLLPLLDSSLPIPLRIIIGITVSMRNMCAGGDRSTAKLCLDILNPLLVREQLSPSITCQWKVVQILYCYWYTAKQDELLASMKEALTLAGESGMHGTDFLILYGGASLHLTDYRCIEGQKLVRKLALVIDFNNNYERSMYHCFYAWKIWLDGDLDDALEHAKMALDYMHQSEIWVDQWQSLIMLAQIYASRSEYGQALRIIARMRHFATAPIYTVRTLFLVYLADAQFALDRGQPNRCDVFLRRALALGRQQNYIRFPYFKLDTVARLYAHALQTGIEVDYVQSVIRQRRLAPPADSLHLDHWPWPLKIYCFGTLELVKDQTPIQFTRKAPKKTLQLLKALIALGGQQIREQRLIDVVWPDEEGDNAHNAFSTTLNRLRRLIGNEAIHLSEGCLSLNPQHCWLDVWRFEYLHKETEAAKPNDDWQRFAQQANTVLALYRDHFLVTDGDEPWMIALRERLRSQFLKTTSALGDGWQARGDWHQAISCYQRGLEIDYLAERFYQGLINCYSQLGMKSEALESYHRCQRMLSLSLGVKPSVATEKLFHALLKS